jgi:hypothetical protein
LLEAELGWIDHFLEELASGRLTSDEDGSRKWAVLRAGWLSAMRLPHDPA